jgi:membrane protein
MSSPRLGKGLGADAQYFWQIPARGWLNVLRRTYSETGSDNLNVIAAGVAFYIFLAFIPLLASIILLYGLAADPQLVAQHILLLVRNLPDDIAAIIADQLQSITSENPDRSGMGLLLALMLSVYGTTRGSTSIVAAMNQVYGETEKRSFLKLTFITFVLALMAIFTGLFAIVAISTTALIPVIVRGAGWLQIVLETTIWSFVALLFAGLVAAIYRYAPCRANARWSWLSPGAFIATIGCFGGTSLFGWYVGTIGNYNATYGTLGAVVTFLMWIFVCTYIILLGAELNAEIERQTGQDTTEGVAQPMGERRAAMADTVETGPRAK